MLALRTAFTAMKPLLSWMQYLLRSFIIKSTVEMLLKIERASSLLPVKNCSREKNLMKHTYFFF